MVAAVDVRHDHWAVAVSTHSLLCLLWGGGARNTMPDTTQDTLVLGGHSQIIVVLLFACDAGGVLCTLVTLSA